MNGQNYLWEITRYLAWFTSQVRIENKNGNFDINKYAESFLIPVLNQVFKKKFQRLEFIKQNYPAIDLGSDDNQISIQVTSETGFDKIKNTLTKYIENKLFDKYTDLYHFVIDESYKPSKTDIDISDHIKIVIEKSGITTSPKVEFKVNKNLINISTLRSLIERECNIDQLKEIRDYLEKQYGKVTSLPYFDDILVPYEIAFKAQLDENNKNLPNQFHTPFFGRDSDIESLETFIHSPDRSVFAIVSDGGYGKTRLAIEIFKKHASEGGKFEAYQLNESAFQCMDFAEQLKTEKDVLILFDDAHNRPEILNDVIGAAQRLKNVKLILTVRKAVYSDTIKNVSSHRRIIGTLELNRLPYEETQALFRSQLAGWKDIEIKKLSEESRGVPVVILGLCQVSLKGQYKSDLSEEANFVQFVRELKEQVISDIHHKYYISEENVNKTIQLISFFSPVNDNPNEIEELSKLNGIAVEETNLILDYLFEYDFISRHHEISIKPDPYSDTILLDSAQRIKYLLQKDLNKFIDRLIRNLVEVEQSKRLDLSIDNLLYEFVSSFRNKPTESNEDIKVLESNLDTLRSFTYKKTQICFIAIKHLILSKLESDDFWKKEEPHILYYNSFKDVHEKIVTILSIAALNSHRITELEEIYELLWTYKTKKLESNIFQQVFRYRIYDFWEYGYHNIAPCERQTFLMKKLSDSIKEEQPDPLLAEHVFNSIKTILALEFEGESYYDKYSHSLSWGRHLVFFNETTQALRIDALKLLITLFKLTRNSPPSGDYLEEILRILFFMAKEKQEKYVFNQVAEVDLVVQFLQELLHDKPTIIERSDISRQLKLFERRELKDNYKEIAQVILDLSENVGTPKEKLSLMFLDEYFSLKGNIESIFKELFEQYPDKEILYRDILETKIELTNTDFTNFSEIILHLTTNYSSISKELLDFVIDLYPQQACDFSTLIKANYKDQEYFYSIINKIWNLDYDCCKGSVLWMLTNGRNREVELYREDDLKYIEHVVENNIVKALWSIPFTLPKYILITPSRTINLISKILKINENARENKLLIHSIFDDKDILVRQPDLIKEFVIKETLEIPLDSHYFSGVLTFLDDYFGFEVLFDYLKDKIIVIVKQNDYLSLSSHDHYDNHKKDPQQIEKEFLSVIQWYADLEIKSEYVHKKLVEYLRPIQIKSEEFKTGFKVLITNVGNNPEKIIDLCNALDVYDDKGEFLISMLIEIANELCDKYDFSKKQLIQIFGSDYIHNFGLKSGIAGSPFPQDLNKRAELIQIMEKYQMHPRVKEIFLYSLEKVNKDIEGHELRDFDEKW